MLPNANPTGNSNQWPNNSLMNTMGNNPLSQNACLCKIVPSLDNIWDETVPTNAPFVFLQNDLSTVYVRAWGDTASVKTMKFTRVSEEEESKLSPNVSQNALATNALIASLDERMGKLENILTKFMESQNACNNGYKRPNPNYNSSSKQKKNDAEG